MHSEARIFVAGHRGLVGSALVRALHAADYRNLVLRSRQELDLTRQSDVERFFERERPEYVFLAAAKVGGILANSKRPAEFIYENLAIQNNVINGAWRHGVTRLIFLGSSCIYPRDCPQPIKEEYLLTSALEQTNRAYAIAKIAGIELCRAYREQHGFSVVCAMPPNLYGPGDNFDPDGSHVLPALVRKFVHARQTGARSVTVWGSGRPLREFMHADDLARALLVLAQAYDPPLLINVGPGTEVSIQQLAEMISRASGSSADIVYDPSMPDGTPRKLLECSQMMATGWRAKVDLQQGIAETITDWLGRCVSDPS